MSGIAAEVLSHPSVKRLKRVAEALGDLAPRIVFIGGSIAPLLQTVPPFDEARPTKDVDGVVATAAYSEIDVLHAALRARGFRQPPSESAHVHRWRSPHDDPLDLVPAGSHLGGSGQLWDQIALDAPTSADLGDGVIIRHAGGPTFLALKWAAYADRVPTTPMPATILKTSSPSLPLGPRSWWRCPNRHPFSGTSSAPRRRRCWRTRA